MNALGNVAGTDRLDQKPYRDIQRYLWLVTPLWCLTPIASIFLVRETGQPVYFWLTPFLLLVVIPILDMIVGSHVSNHPDDHVARLEKDPYYHMIPYLTLIGQYGSLVAGGWAVGTMDLTWHAYAGIALSVGIINGFAVVTGHELGHKKGALDRWLAKAALATGFYGQYIIDHNRGHHRDVATPEDSGSARFGENFYQFTIRQIPHSTLKRPWQLEKDRLARRGKGPWSLENEFIQPALMSLFVYGALLAIFGVVLIPYLFVAAATAYIFLALADYLEHYGLLREKMPDGRYERVRPEHSWNTNHIASNMLFFHAQRHSDHHAWPTRRYHVLKSYPDLPTLPSGYPGMFGICLVPPLWRKIMHPRLLAVAGRDIAKINTDPRKRARLMQRYGLTDSAAQASRTDAAPSPATTAAAVPLVSDVTEWSCPGCGYTYSEDFGDLSQGFSAGTRWSDVPEDWSCPDCAVRDKTDFVPAHQKLDGSFPL